MDVVVVYGWCMVICWVGCGGFKDIIFDEFFLVVMIVVFKDVNLRLEELGDICVGNVL